MTDLIATASQTIGPFWHLIEHAEWADLTRLGAPGERMVLLGKMTDGEGAPVTDACVEIWQTDPPTSEIFPGFGRARTNADGTFQFTTIKPGSVAGPGNSQQAPHIAIAIQARGLMQALITRAYFAGEPLNEIDPVLGMITEPERRASLIATPEGSGAWQLDIRLQGERETVFLQV